MARKVWILRYPTQRKQDWDRTWTGLAWEQVQKKPQVSRSSVGV